MDDQIVTSVDAGQENVVDSQQTTVNEPVNAGSEEVATPQTGVKQTQEQNAQFAQVRREAETRAKDAVIAEQGYEWNGQPITTYAQYQQALAEQKANQEAEKLNIDPAFYNEFTQLKNKVSSYETERQQVAREKLAMQQENDLKNDPVRGELYKQWEKDVKQNATNYGIDIKTSFLIMLDEKLSDVLTGTKSQAEQSAIQKLINNGQSSPGSLSQGAEGQSKSVNSMSSADFKKLQDGVLRGEIKTL